MKSLGILANFLRNGHIDPDLYEVFVRSGVYRKYGEKILNSAQLDEVDEARLLAQARTAA